MKRDGKLDYLELPATDASLDSTKAFYARVFGWTFIDYGPTYAAFDQGIEGGFQADRGEAPAKPLPILFSENLEVSLDAVVAGGGMIVRPIFAFPGGRRFHFTDPAGNELAVWGK